MRSSILLVALLAVGCSSGISLVVVEVSAATPLDGIAGLSVQATAGGRDANFTVKAPSGSFSIGPSTQTFGIDLPKGLSGPINVAVDAVDETGSILASGAGSATIKPGSRVDLPLELMVAHGPAPDMSDLSDIAGADLALPSTTPMLATDRSMQKFGSVTVDKTSNAVMIKITNQGDTGTGALAFQSSGANLDQFSFSNGCSGTLAPNASCFITAEFKPTSAGDKSAHFDVSAVPGGSVGVDVSGTGQPPGTLSITADAPYNGDCGSAVIGQISGTFATYTVTNVGTSTTGALTVSTGDSQFLATGCTGTLDAGNTCSITVHIKPTVGGAITSSVQVTASPGGTAPANVRGKGLNPAAFKLTSGSGSFSFGSAQRNSAGSVITFTATNTGDIASSALAHSSFSGPAASSFLITNNGCYLQAVAPAASCTVQVEFKPLASGSLSATLRISDASGVLGMANVSGTGTPIWVQESLPLPTGKTSVPAMSVVFGSATDASHIYAAGGSAYYERDATGAWSYYAINPAAVTVSMVSQGSAIGVNSVFLASDVGVLASTAPTSWSGVFQAGSVEGIVAFSATDAWAAHGTGTAIQLYRRTASGWAADVSQTGYADRAAIWGSSDSDVWLGGGVVLNVSGVTQSTPQVWHRDSGGTWTPQTVAECSKNSLPLHVASPANPAGDSV